MSQTKKQINVLGQKVCYWEYGATNMPLVVMIHGFRGTHHGFEKIVEKMPAYHCVVPDLPGFGQSDPFTDAHTLDNYVTFVAAFLAKIADGKQCHLVGHSFGSIVVSHVAAEHPASIDKLILINPISAPALKGPKKIATKAALLYYGIGRRLPQKSADKFLSSRFIVDAMSHQMTISKDKELRAYVFDQHRQHFSTFASPKVVAEAFKTSVSHTTTDVVERITIPTLVLAAERDQISNLGSQVSFARKLQNGTLQVINEVGHLVHYEKATEAAAAIDDFLTA